MPKATTAHDRYEALRTAREPFLRRAREVAEVTLPYLFPPEGATGDTDLPTPFQSVGARGVNNLASKLLLTLFPPNTGFFEVSIDDFAMDELAGPAGEEGSEEARAEIKLALASIVRAVEKQTEQTGARNRIFEAVKNLLVGGNILIQVLNDNRFRLYTLSQYVVKRDGEGAIVDIVIKELISRRTASPEILAIVGEDSSTADLTEESPEDTIPIYTWVRRETGKKKWVSHQEVGTEGRKLDGSDGSYPMDASPFIPLRLIEVASEDYGRGYAEEYLGDLLSLEKGTQSVIEYSAAAARILLLVDPGGVTDLKDVAEAGSGEVIEGNARDITTLSLEKFADFRITNEQNVRLERRLEQSFLLLAGLQRDAERVTAEEIRQMAEELEEALGGVYSLLAEELQAPLVRRIMANMQRANRLPKLPKDLVNLKVVTGLAALGRNDELHRLDFFLAGMAEIVGPEAIGDYIPLSALFKRKAAALNLDIEIRSEAEVGEIRQQRAQAAAAEKAAGPGVTAMGQLAGQVAEAASPQGGPADG